MSATQRAPNEKFRVIGVDTFAREDWVEGDFETLDIAKAHANSKVVGKQMLKMHIYDDLGRHQYEAGTF